MTAPDRGRRPRYHGLWDASGPGTKNGPPSHQGGHPQRFGHYAKEEWSNARR